MGTNNGRMMMGPGMKAGGPGGHPGHHRPAGGDLVHRQDDSEESGVGHEEDEEVQQLIVELLSNITTPRVSEILATSALLKWGPPLKDPTDPKFENTLDHITEDSDFSYEVIFAAVNF